MLIRSVVHLIASLTCILETSSHLLPESWSNMWHQSSTPLSTSNSSAKREMRLLEKEMAHNVSVPSLIFLVETTSTHIFINASTNAFSFRWKRARS